MPMTPNGFHLLREAWLPVRRTSGRIAWITPSQIVGDEDDPCTAVASPRADFNGALTEFLIGLVQTCFAPADDDAWLGRLFEPPSPDELRAAFDRHEAAFELLGSARRFMQDVDLADAAPVQIGALLIDEPGENTLKNNADLFVKRGRVAELSPAAAAMALITLQTYAPSGGAGHRTSLRGGGPLTTLVVGGTLWQTVWLNVLPVDAFADQPGWRLSEPAAIFPWLAATRVSGKNGRPTYPGEAHPYQVFWGMPRRIKLHEAEADGSCALTGEHAERLITSYGTRPYGVNYEGEWLHPLTPYNHDASATPARQPRHPQPTGLDYRHWLGLVQNVDAGSTGTRERRRLPAAVVERLIRLAPDLREEGYPDRRPRLWAFGYDMDNMKPRSWQESVMPLIAVADDARRGEFEADAATLVRAASEGERAVVGKVRQALSDRPAELKGEAFAAVSAGLINRTEGSFYAHLRRLADETAAVADRDARHPLRAAIRVSWRDLLAGAALDAFDKAVLRGELLAENVGRVARARRELRAALFGSALRKLLNLPVTAKKEAA